MICKVIETIEEYSLLDGVSSVAVGVSGGADSMCLLHILSSLKDKYDITLKAVHINHNLRGEEAKRDEELVRAYCLESNIELSVHSVDVNSLSVKLGIGTEECGRKIRYECFGKAGCDAVAVAHSLSDSVETTVYNLLRGTGLKGLCGIPVKRKPNIIRPLIFCSREEIEAYCKKHKIPFVTDSTNLGDDYTRNYIRHHIIPSFEKVNPSFQAAVSRSGEILSDENDFIERSAQELLLSSAVEDGFDVRALASAHIAPRKRALLCVLDEKMNKQTLSKHVELVNEIVEKGQGKVKISQDLFALAEKGKLTFVEEEKESVRWESVLANGKFETPFGVYLLEKTEEYTDAVFDGDRVCGDLRLTCRKEGDSFTFKKRGVTKTLKKLFNELKIPPTERNKLAVLRDGKNIIWVEGVGVNAPYIPTETSHKKFVIKKDE